MLIGETIKDRYRIYDRLGVGGAATVYLGRDSKTGQMVIIKVVHAHLVNEQFIGRFQREIDLLQQLDNPYIIELYDWALREYDPSIGQTLSYIVAEFVEGHTLADIIDTRGRLPESDALAIARQIALGLSDVHNSGVVHRDVKSQNIMLTPDNNVKLIDFGIAKGQDHATLTRSSHFAGTLYYAPPEQILGAAGVDHRADIYALGVVLYEMLTASLPIKDHEMGTVASKIIAGDIDPVTGVSEPVEQLVVDLMATRLQERIASADEVINRIDMIIGGAHEPDLPDRPAATTTSEFRVFPEAQADEIEEKYHEKFVLVTSDGRPLDIKVPETIIGRSHPRHAVDPDIDLWGLELEGARTVSRRHCRIVFEDDVYYLEDLSSMNGTFLNGEQLEPGEPVELQDGDALSAGRVELTFKKSN